MDAQYGTLVVEPIVEINMWDDKLKDILTSKRY
jgi:hypothetical protein